MNWKSNGEDDDDMVLSKSNVLLCVNGNLLLAGCSALPQEEEPTAIDEIDRQRRRPDDDRATRLVYRRNFFNMLRKLDFITVVKEFCLGIKS